MPDNPNGYYSTIVTDLTALTFKLTTDPFKTDSLYTSDCKMPNKLISWQG